MRLIRAAPLPLCVGWIDSGGSQRRIESDIEKTLRFPEPGGKFLGGEACIEVPCDQLARRFKDARCFYTCIKNGVEKVFALRVSVIDVAMLARKLLQSHQNLPLKEAGFASHNLDEIAIAEKFRDGGLQVREAVVVEADAIEP
jgi:hypothetical protein